MEKFKIYLINSILFLICLTLVVFIFKNLNVENNKILLDLIKAIVYPGVILYSVLIFKDEVKFFIKNIKIKTPGGFEFDSHFPPVQETIKVDDLSLADLFSEDTNNQGNGSTPIKIEQFNEVKHTADILAKELLFERIYYYIYGSQINLLKKLKLYGTDGMNLLDVVAHFEMIKNIYGDFYKDMNIEKYLEFLAANNLLEKKENGGVMFIRITQPGNEFIEYLMFQKYIDKTY
ncbi:MAG: hypothetical protein PHN60_02835 [Candidatus Gracilibacteria bacterium]|nr:hypothetical protein [Candidatus Gracilibacteria bacterium]